MTPSDGGRIAQILIADDNDDDIELLRVGLRRSRFALQPHAVHDGEECMEFLRQQGRHSAAPRPDLLLLDLNMPRMDGREVLAAIANDPDLAGLPVIVLSTSTINSDIVDAYRLSANSYVVKPIDFDRFVSAVQSIVDYWFTVAVLPDQRQPPGIAIRGWAPRPASTG